MAASARSSIGAQSGIASPDLDVGHCRLNLAVLFSPEIAETFRRVYESEAGRQVEPWWDIHQLLAYGDDWPTFIPVQVAGRAPVDIRGMTGRVEKLLVMALARCDGPGRETTPSVDQGRRSVRAPRGSCRRRRE